MGAREGERGRRKVMRKRGMTAALFALSLACLLAPRNSHSSSSSAAAAAELSVSPARLLESDAFACKCSDTHESTGSQKRNATASGMRGNASSTSKAKRERERSVRLQGIRSRCAGTRSSLGSRLQQQQRERSAEGIMPHVSRNACEGSSLI